MLTNLYGQDLDQWQRERISLSGMWQSSLGDCRLPGTTDENRLGDGRHAVQETSRLTRLYPYFGQVTYERDVTLPASWEGKRLRLVMERTKPSTLWIDGDSIGSYGHIYAPHCYELPPLTAGTHRIRIRIDNSPAVVPAEVQNSHAWSESTQTNWNGILGEFFLEARDCSYIEDVQVYPDPEKKCAGVWLSVFAEKRGKASVRLGGQSWNASETRRIVPVLREVCLQKGRNELTFTIDMGDDPLLWSEFHPALYRLEIELRQGNRRDGCHVDFGMRRFYTEDAQLMLNGKKIFLRASTMPVFSR